MNELAVVEHCNERVLTTSQIAELYGSTPKRITENFTRNREWYTVGKHYHYLEGEALREFVLHTALSGVQNLKVRALYLWTEKGALLIAKSLDTPQAWEVYQRLVDDYYRVKAELAQQPAQPKLPATYIEALKQLVVSEEARQQAEAQQAALAAALSQETTTREVTELALVVHQERKKQEDQINAPKLSAYEQLMDSDGTVSMRSAAEILGLRETTNGKVIGRNKLFQWLEDQGVVARDRRPYQRYVEAGYFRVIVTVAANDVPTPVTRVTPRGLEWISTRWAKTHAPQQPTCDMPLFQSGLWH